jgi:hypothetical protein
MYQQILVQTSNTKFHKNLFGGSHSVPRGRTDMTKATVTVRNSFANAPKPDISFLKCLEIEFNWRPCYNLLTQLYAGLNLEVQNHIE